MSVKLIFVESTTGNVYGIYDMCGGADEYVASYYTGGYWHQWVCRRFWLVSPHIGSVM